jgi:alcohol dehydrogenase class IV
MGILCNPCKDMVKKAIGAMPADLTCAAAAAAIVAAIEAAGGGPEDPVADALAAVAVAVTEELCEKYGWPWIHSHRSEVAEAMCKAAKLC